MQLDDEAIFRTFVAESEEGLAVIEEALIGLERGGDRASALQATFRAAHTLKGNALNLDLPEITEVAHLLEDVLGRMRDGERTPSPGVVTALLGAVDVLRRMVPAAAAGTLEGDAESARVTAALRRIASGESPDEETAPAAPANVESTDMPVAGRARTLRVNIDTLDRLLNLTGEIAVARARVQQAIERGGSGAMEAHHEADRLHAELQELVMRARMIAVGPTFRSYRRAVRDIAAAHGKQAELLLEGEDVEVDTRVVEHLRDPLTHMIRNALDHGIESPEIRRARGKPPCGRIRLTARHEAGRIVVELSDDGAGLDRERIVAKAVALGLVAPDAVTSLSTADIHRLLFAPGFSTADSVTELSGRGVGLDVVRRNIEAVRGTITLATEPGAGTRVTIRLPLTVAIIPGFAVGVGDETYVVPLDAVLECVELPAEARDAARPTGVLNLRGEPMPFLRLRHQFACPPGAPDREHVVVVHHEGGKAGLAVDSLLGESQTVLKPLGRFLGEVPGIAGAAVLGGGRVGLVLDVPALIQERLAGPSAAEPGASPH